MYCLSQTPDLRSAPYLVAPAEFIFKHWQGQHHLLEVEYLTSDVLDTFEDGHHDMASSFSTDYYEIVARCQVKQHWQLNDLTNVTRLLNSAFYQQHQSALIHGSEFQEILLDLLPEQDYPQLVQQLGLRRSDLLWLQSRPTVIEHMLKLGIVTEMDILTEARPCLEAVFRSHQAESQSVRSALALDALAADKPFRHHLREDDFISVDVEILLSLLGAARANNPAGEEPDVVRVARILKCPETLVNGDKLAMEQLVDRLAVLGKPEWLSDHHHYQPRIQASLEAIGLFSEPSQQWQTEQAPDSLKTAASQGLLQEVKRLCQSAQQDELNSALLAAARQGYTGIVALLHQQGADLGYSSQFAIKYANKYGYGQLREYLLANGLPDLHFQ